MELEYSGRQKVFDRIGYLAIALYTTRLVYTYLLLGGQIHYILPQTEATWPAHPRQPSGGFAAHSCISLEGEAHTRAFYDGIE